MIRKGLMALAIVSIALPSAASVVPPSHQALVRAAPPLHQPASTFGQAKRHQPYAESRYIAEAVDRRWTSEITYVAQGGRWSVQRIELTTTPRDVIEDQQATDSGFTAVSAKAEYDPSIQPVTPPDARDPNAPGPGTPRPPSGRITNEWWAEGYTFEAVYRYGVVDGVLGWHLVSYTVKIGPRLPPRPTIIQ